METTFRPVSKRRLAELQGYVAWSTSLFRVVVFVGVVGAVAWLLRAAHGRLLPSRLQHDVWWIAPAVAFGVAVYLIAGRWTGGPSFRASVRADLARGLAAVHRVVAVDAIEVEEREDEGPAYFVLTADRTTMLFAGQYLEGYKRKGFPWREFEILEAPASKVFFGIMPCGERLTPSIRRPPFTWEEFKRFRTGKQSYAVLDVQFETLKSDRMTKG